MSELQYKKKVDPKKRKLNTERTPLLLLLVLIVIAFITHHRARGYNVKGQKSKNPARAT